MNKTDNDDEVELKLDKSKIDEIEINEDDTVWNAYIDQYGHEPKTPSQLQSFSKNHSYKSLSFKLSKQVFNERSGKGKVTK